MADARILDGRALAAARLDALKARVAGFTASQRRAPGLAVLLVGDNAASQVYVASKRKAAAAAGIRSVVARLPANCGAAALHKEIGRLNRDASIDGILLQLPLPDGLPADPALALIDPKKDVDGLTPTNAGLLAQGQQAMAPATPRGIMALLELAHPGGLAGADALVLGRSRLVGRPVAALLTGANATVTLAHSQSQDLPGLVGRASILVAAVGRPGMVRGDWIRPGATVIDVGINRLADGGLCGDVDFAAARARAGAITPVPGGVGPLTVACLLENTMDAAERMAAAPAA